MLRGKMSLSEQSPVFVASSFLHDNRTRFSGVAYTPDSIIVGEEGLTRYLQAHGVDTFCGSVVDGRFFAFLELENQYRAFSDPLSQDTLFYYRNGNNWAVSNSLLGLAEFLYGKVKLTAYRPALLSFFIGKGSGIGAQPISNRSVFAEINMLPVGKAFVVEKTTGQSRLEGSVSSITKSFSDLSYEELISTSLNEGISRIRALKEHGVSLSSDLTGGYDSRACSGLMLRALGDLSQVRLISNPRKTDDYEVATSLAARYGSRLHRNSAKAVTVDTETAYDRWKAGNIGTYLPAYLPSTGMPTYSQFKANGGMILAKQFAEQSAHDFAKSLEPIYGHPDNYQWVKREFLSAFDDLEIDPSHPHAMDWHYLGFRGRYHYGRASYTSLVFPIISPLINPKMVAASLKLPREQLDGGKLSLDILMALDPVLALHPFDSSAKTFTPSEIEESPFWRSQGLTLNSGTSTQRYTVFSDKLNAPEKADDTNVHEVSKGCLELMSQDLKTYSRESALVNELFSKKQLDSIAKELDGKGKTSSRTRQASHVITCGVVDALIT